jgi:hypothetical protein
MIGVVTGGGSVAVGVEAELNLERRLFWVVVGRVDWGKAGQKSTVSVAMVSFLLVVLGSTRERKAKYRMPAGREAGSRVTLEMIVPVASRKPRPVRLPTAKKEDLIELAMVLASRVVLWVLPGM